MTRHENATRFSRRALLKAGGALVVSVGAPVGLDTVLGISQAFAQGALAQGTKPPLTPDQLSSYIAINADGSVAAFFGKMDMGQGLFVAIGQMVAEELDVPFKAVTVIMGDTATSVNQGGASGSTGIQMGGKQMRMAAAEARRVLVELAAAKLGLAADQLTVTDGTVHSKSDASKKATYAELIGGRYFNVQLDWNKQMGNPLYAPGKAKPKDPKDYKIVGQPIAREDIAPKVYAQEDFCTDVKVPGMVHGRMIRPAVAGAVPVKVDDSSIKDISGAKVVWDKGFLGVVADTEWDAIKAAQQLKVEWSDVKAPFPDQTALYEHIRKAGVRKREVGGKETGNVDEAFKTAARVVEAEYEWPFQSHACMGPACALVEIKDGNVTCWTGSQKPHFVQNGIALSLGIPVEKVRSIWVVGPGSYGRSDADDAAMDAAVLANAVGKPVRVQYTRAEATGWDRRAPPPSTAPAPPSTPRATSSPTSSPARGSRASTCRPTAASRRTRSPGSSAACRSWSTTASACRRNPTSSPTSAWRGRPSRRCSTAARRCAARICAIRSDRRSTSPASRSWTRWRRRSGSTRSSCACAT
jgi:nicotinate dehydrogenase subunit B